MTKIEAELHRNLTPREYGAITSRLNLWHSVELLITNRTPIGKAKLARENEPTEIILLKEGKDARLSYPQRFERTPSWEGSVKKVKVEMVN